MRAYEALLAGEALDRGQFEALVHEQDEAVWELIRARAREVSEERFGNRVYTRGLIEISSYCRQNCYYCGIRAGNTNAQRYRLTREEVLECCDAGYELGFRTFVLQGGEDPHFSDERLCGIVSAIKSGHPDCAITLSVGERESQSYRRLREAGADRYLLRHETADAEHYAMLHPESQSLAARKACLYELKRLGYQVGTGFMVGSPGQTPECLAKDLEFLQEFRPHMVGIGPFIPHHDTDFRNEPAGSAELTVRLLSVIRLLLPDALLPATTALATAAKDGREQGILSGANVVMPNLSPLSVRSKYSLYDNKAATGAEAAEFCRALGAATGYELVVDRGDYRGAIGGCQASS